MDTFKKLTDEVSLKIRDSFSTKEFTDFLLKTKSADDNDTGDFEVVITTDDEDRHGEIVSISGWDTERYMENPVVLFGHDYYSLPIGICTSIRVEGNKLIAKGKFAPASANPFAQQCRKLYDLGILKATSVGFIAEEMKDNVITKAQLLEFSFVPVPANPYALSLRQIKELGIDREMFKVKGIEIKEVEEPTQEIKTFLSEKAVEQINFTISLLKGEINALQNILATAKVETGGKTEEVRVESSNEKKSMDEWLFVQNILKAVTNASSSALARVNAKVDGK